MSPKINTTFSAQTRSATLLGLALGLPAALVVCLSNVGLAKTIPVEIEKDVVDDPAGRDSSKQSGDKVLPSQFLGTWQVESTRKRTKNNRVEKRFNPSMHNVLIIAGSPGQYYLGSSTGFQSPITIDKIAGGMAILRSVQGEQYEFGELVAKKVQLLKLRVSRDGRKLSGSFVFDLTFESGEHISVSYYLSGHKMS